MLHYANLWNEDWINALPRWGGTKWRYPSSHLLKTELRRYFADIYPTDEDFSTAYHAFEYRLGLLQAQIEGYWAISGEYVGDYQWEREGDIPKEETAFRRLQRRTRANAWETYFKGADGLETALVALREVLRQYRRAC